MKWIDIKEYKPEEGSKVIAYGMNPACIGCQYCWDWKYCKYEEGLFKFVYVDERNNILEKTHLQGVTHWTHFPFIRKPNFDAFDFYCKQPKKIRVDSKDNE